MRTSGRHNQGYASERGSRPEARVGRDAAIVGGRIGRRFGEAEVAPAFQAAFEDDAPTAAHHGLGIDGISKADAGSDIGPIGVVGIARLAIDTGKDLTA